MNNTDKKILARLMEDRKAIANQIDKIESAEKRRINGGHVGQHFKMIDKPRDPYPQYAKVVRMDAGGMLFYNSFQRDKTGNTDFYVEHCGYHMQYWTRITKAEYDRAARKIVQHASSMISA